MYHKKELLWSLWVKHHLSAPAPKGPKAPAEPKAKAKVKAKAKPEAGEGV